MKHEKSVAIRADAATVWSVLTDVERWPEWTESFTSAEVVGGGPLAVGTEVRIKQPRLRPVTMTVDEVVPQRFFSWSSRSPGLATVAGHLIEERSDGVTVTLSIDFRGALAPVVGLFYGRLVRRYVDLEAAGLQARSEATAGSAG